MIFSIFAHAGDPEHADIYRASCSITSRRSTRKTSWLLEHERQLTELKACAQAVELIQHLHHQERELAILTRNAKLAALTLQAIDLLDYFSDALIFGRG